jgi:DNA polymerase-3 subunit beta
MQFTIAREALLEPLQRVVSVVEQRHNVPILSHVLLVWKDNELCLTTTDGTIELSVYTHLNTTQEGATTVSAHKLLDICQSLPKGAELNVRKEGAQLVIHIGTSYRSSLLTLPTEDFPLLSWNIETTQPLEFTLPKKKLRFLIRSTQFAMLKAQGISPQLTGMRWELTQQNVRMVATDGHRLALSSAPTDSESPQNVHAQDGSLGSNSFEKNLSILVPRKTISELSRLFAESREEENDEMVKVLFSPSESPVQLQVKTKEYRFTSKLMDDRFPNYTSLVAQEGGKWVSLDRDLFKQALTQAAVLADDTHRGVWLQLASHNLYLVAKNDRQEEAKVQVDCNYPYGDFEIAFNVDYLLEALNSLPSGEVKLLLGSSDERAILKSVAQEDSTYLIMPLRL